MGRDGCLRGLKSQQAELEPIFFSFRIDILEISITNAKMWESR